MEDLILDKIICLLVAFLLCISIICFILGTISHIPPTKSKDKSQNIQPYCFWDSSIRWSAITDFAVCEDIIYVLFSGKGVMDCYSLDGEYLFSYAIDLGKKGKAELYLSDTLLFVKTKDFKMHVFENGVFVDTFDVPVSELALTLNSLITSKQHSGKTLYKLDKSSICQETTNGLEKIISRPGWMVVFQGSILSAIGGISFVLFCITFIFCKKRYA